MALVIVGLGNPGKEYAKTRHNAGWIAVEKIAKKGDFNEFAPNTTARARVATGVYAGGKVTLVLPETMMNASGKAVAHFIKTPKAAKTLLVIHDDLDLPLGVIKMVSGRGSGGHKGVESVMRAIRSKEFARIRIGISAVGKGNQAKKVSGEEKVIKRVLGAFAPAEEALFKKAVKKAVETAEIFVSDGPAAATQFANTR